MKKKRIDPKVILAIILLVAFLGTYLAGVFSHKKLHHDPDETDTITNQLPVVNDQGPQFVKQGELSFLAASDRHSIKRIAIEIADTDSKRQMGLMFRKSMVDTNGMLFLFPVSEPQNFWMHNTYIPLDIIYVNENREIVTIGRNCKVLNDADVPSGKDAQFVVEVNGGFCDKNGIKEGDLISF